MRKLNIQLLLYFFLGTFVLISLDSCKKGMLKNDQENESTTYVAEPPIDCCPSPDELCDPCNYPQCRLYYDCPSDIIYKLYGGVAIAYYPYENILEFSTQEDLNKVLDKLDADYEAHNTSYENQYPNLTPEELDAKDEATGFDEFATYRAFEGLFPGYISQRASEEAAEEQWLANGMTGADPANNDPTFDHSENAIAGNGAFKVGGTMYYTSSENVTPMSTFMPECKHNIKASKLFTSPDGVRRFKLKVAVHSWWVRSSVKTKVVSYIKKGSRWKRSRVHLLVGCSGVIRDNNCSTCANPNITTGYKKRKELKTVFRTWGQWYRAMPNDVSGVFHAENITQGTFKLSW